MMLRFSQFPKHEIKKQKKLYTSFISISPLLNYNGSSKTQRQQEYTPLEIPGKNQKLTRKQIKR